MKRASVAFLAFLASLSGGGCGTPLEEAEHAYSVEESTARKSYIIVGTAFAQGRATRAQMAEASRHAFLLASLAREVSK